MNNLFDDDFKGERDGEPWKRSEKDRLLNMWCAGEASIARISLRLDRTPESIRTKIKEFQENLHNRAVNYRPKKRNWRGGMKFTENEELMLKSFVKRGLPLDALAKVLQRPLSELQPNKRTRVLGDVKEMRKLVPSLDVIWACRYAYFVWCKDGRKPLITDKEYDDLVMEEIEYGGGEKEFEKIKQHQGWPDGIKSLALYLAWKKDSDL